MSKVSQYNQKTIVETLLRHDADKTIKDNEGKTALDYAKEKELNEIIELLN